MAACAPGFAGDRCTGWLDDCQGGRPVRHFAMARRYRSAFSPLRRLLVSWVVSGLDVEQLCRSPPEDVGLFVIAQRRRRKDVVDRLQLPGIGIIAADHDLASADLSYQMPDCLRREDQ